MAQTLKTYVVVCPASYCAEEFQVERDPAELAQGEGDLIECPACLEEWEWDYVPASPEHPEDELILSGDDEADDDEADDMGLTCDDDDEDDEDEY
jgi:hypothetical protein